jgi:hypothetical protein
VLLTLALIGLRSQDLRGHNRNPRPASPGSTTEVETVHPLLSCTASTLRPAVLDRTRTTPASQAEFPSRLVRCAASGSGARPLVPCAAPGSGARPGAGATGSAGRAGSGAQDPADEAGHTTRACGYPEMGPCSPLTSVPPVTFSGRIEALGSIRCTRMHRILPEARILPDLGYRIHHETAPVPSATGQLTLPPRLSPVTGGSPGYCGGFGLDG